MYLRSIILSVLHFSWFFFSCLLYKFQIKIILKVKWNVIIKHYYFNFFFINREISHYCLIFNFINVESNIYYCWIPWTLSFVYQNIRIKLTVKKFVCSIGKPEMANNFSKIPMTKNCSSSQPFQQAKIYSNIEQFNCTAPSQSVFEYHFLKK